MKKRFFLIEAILVLTVIAAACALVVISIATVKDHRRCVAELPRLGYDVADVGVFLKGTDYSCGDFIGSRGLRAQYELFRDGKVSGFMEQARAKKSADDAQATANMAMGMSAASIAISAGSR